MSGASVDFATQVTAWCLATKERALAVFQQSCQEVIEVMQTPVGAGGNMPIQTGFLRASLRGFAGSVSSAPAIKPGVGAAPTDNAASISLVISNLKLGDAITVLYLANYAQRVNYGFVGTDSLGRKYNQSGRLFVDLAAQQWPAVVSRVIADAQSRVP